MLMLNNKITGESIKGSCFEYLSGGWVVDGAMSYPDPDRTVYAVIDPVIEFNYPTAAETATDMTVNLEVVNRVDNSPMPITETYNVPLINIITGNMDQMLRVPVSGGIGQVTFKVINPGRYSIRTDLILPTPTAEFSETPDIAIFSNDVVPA